MSAGWWLVAVALWPVDSRPYIGGSTDNSPLELAFGYNGLGRIFGGQGNGGGGARRGAEMAGGVPAVPRPLPAGCRPAGGGMGGFGGQAGLTRLFNAEIGGQISWLLPAALILLGRRRCGSPAARPGRTGCAPRCWSGAAGRSSPHWCSP